MSRRIDHSLWFPVRLRGTSARGATTASLVALALVILSFGTAAAAGSPPVAEQFSFDFNVTIPAGTWCSFPVDVDAHAEGTNRTFANGDIRTHVEYFYTYTANGRTVVENEPNNLLAAADGSVVVTGPTWHFLSGGGGNVEIDAGRLVFSPDGSVTFEAGTHPVIDRVLAGGMVHDGAFCAALAA